MDEERARFDCVVVTIKVLEQSADDGAAFFGEVDDAILGFLRRVCCELTMFMCWMGEVDLP